MTYWIQDEKGWRSYDSQNHPLIRLLADRAGRTLQPGCAFTIAAAGAGGKTSLLWALQRECQLRSLQVLVTTTTHMMLTEEMLKTGKAAGIPLHPQIRQGSWVKCKGPSAASLETFRQSREVLLIEADGSRRLPMKVPNEREPVIPPWCEVILVVCGLSSLGHPLEQVCHRHQLLLWQSGVPGTSEGSFSPPTPWGSAGPLIVTPKLLAWVMDRFYLRPLRLRFPKALIAPVWNQADTAGLLAAARETASLCGWDFQLITRLKPDL